jgi:Helicase associated domain
VWITKCRSKRRRGKLALQRIAEMDALGIVWHPRTDDWERGMTAAREYHAANGHLRVPTSYVAPDGFKLGTWLGTRRTERKRGDLVSRRIADLDALGMAWDPYEEAWQQGLAAAREYRAEHGDLGIPRGYVTRDGFALGSWIKTRRAEKRKGKLAPERAARLEALPGWEW